MFHIPEIIWIWNILDPDSQDNHVLVNVFLVSNAISTVIEKVPYSSNFRNMEHTVNDVQRFHIQEIIWIWNLPNHYTNGIADKKGIHQNSTILMSGERVQRFSQNLNNVE